MNISSNINSFAFGKTPVMSCVLKKSSGKEKACATLYQLNARDINDVNEVKYSKTGGRALYSDMREDFLSDSQSAEYYLLKDNDTDEVINAAKVTRHYTNADVKNKGFYTLINEFSVNKKYVNAAEPVLGYIAKTADDRCDNAVVSALDIGELPALKKASFSQTKNNDWVLPQKRFHSLINKAEERSQIEFLG